MGESTVLVNKAKWEEISPELQLIVRSSFENEWHPFIAESIALEGESIQKFKDSGVVVEPLAAEIEEAFAVAAQEFYAEARAADPMYDKIMESMFRWKEMCQGAGI